MCRENRKALPPHLPGLRRQHGAVLQLSRAAVRLTEADESQSLNVSLAPDKATDLGTTPQQDIAGVDLQGLEMRTSMKQPAYRE